MHSNRIAYRLHNLLRCPPRCICPHPHAFLSPIFYPRLDVFSLFSIAFVFFPHPGTFSIRENDWVSLFVLAKNLKSTIDVWLIILGRSNITMTNHSSSPHFEELDRTTKRSAEKRTDRRERTTSITTFCPDWIPVNSDCIYANLTTSVTSGTCRATFLKENKWRTMIALSFARNRFE